MDNSNIELTSINTENTTIKNKNIKKTPWIIVAIIFIGILVTSGIFVYKVTESVKEYDNKIYPGIKVIGEDVGGLTKEDLNDKLKSIVKELGQRQIEVSVGKKKYNITQDNLSLSIDYEGIQKELMSYGKDGNIFEKFKKIRNAENINYSLDILYDNTQVKKFITTISDESYIEPKDASINITGNEITIEDSIVGREVNNVVLSIAIDEAIKNNNIKADTVIEAVFEEKEPSITTDKLSQIDTKISSYTTYFAAGGRAENIRLGTLNIDNTLLMPGDEFSAVKAIGPTTPELGFQESPIYIGGKVSTGYGGGVCQIATTLYNTELRAGIKPINRQNHSMSVSYVGLGLDAAIGDELPDLVFKNTLDYPIVINASVVNGAITIEFWSNVNATNGITYEPTTISTGELSVDTYLKGYDEDGKCVINEYLNSSSYLPSQNH